MPGCGAPRPPPARAPIAAWGHPAGRPPARARRPRRPRGVAGSTRPAPPTTPSARAWPPAAPGLAPTKAASPSRKPKRYRPSSVERRRRRSVAASGGTSMTTTVRRTRTTLWSRDAAMAAWAAATWRRQASSSSSASQPSRSAGPASGAGDVRASRIRSASPTEAIRRRRARRQRQGQGRPGPVETVGPPGQHEARVAEGVPRTGGGTAGGKRRASEHGAAPPRRHRRGHGRSAPARRVATRRCTAASRWGPSSRKTSATPTPAQVGEPGGSHSTAGSPGQGVPQRLGRSRGGRSHQEHETVPRPRSHRLGEPATPPGVERRCRPRHRATSPTYSRTAPASSGRAVTRVRPACAIRDENSAGEGNASMERRR